MACGFRPWLHFLEMHSELSTQWTALRTPWWLVMSASKIPSIRCRCRYYSSALRLRRSGEERKTQNYKKSAFLHWQLAGKCLKLWAVPLRTATTERLLKGQSSQSQRNTDLCLNKTSKNAKQTLNKSNGISKCTAPPHLLVAGGASAVHPASWHQWELDFYIHTIVSGCLRHFLSKRSTSLFTRSMDWFKGKSTGNHGLYPQI